MAVGFFLVKQKTAYEMRIRDWSSDVCSSDLISTRSAQDKPIDGCLPDVSVEGAQRRTAKGQEILHLLGNIDDEALPHEYALTAKLARFFAQAWSKADRKSVV